MAMIELVDFNETYNAGKAKKKTTRRSRRGTGAKAETVAPVVETKIEEVADDVEAKVEDVEPKTDESKE